MIGAGIRADLEALAHPRPAGSGAEARARAHVRARLEGLGYAVTEEPFTYDDRALRVGYPALLLVAAGAFGLAALGLAPLLLTAVLALAIGVPVIVATGGGAPPFTDGTRRRSANLTARPGDDATPDPTSGHLVVVAHVDAKSQRLSFLGRTVAAAVAMLGVLLVVGAGVGAMVGGGEAWVAVGRIGALLAGFGLGATGLAGYGDDSPGALDNASGVAALLALAEALPARLRGRARLTLVVTGAEELGLVGADRWVARHRHELHRASVVNLDTVGGRGPLLLTGHDRSRGVGTARALADVLAVAADEAGVPLVRRMVPFPGGVDSFVFARAGVAAVTLAAGTATSTFRHVHRPSDTVARVDLDNVVRSVELVLSASEALVRTASRRDVPPR